MWISSRGVGMGRRLVLPAVVLGASLIATVPPASGKVLAYRTSDGSADPAFVKLGATTTVERVVPDGARGAYLIGKIAVNGGERQIVHLLAGGDVDPVFRPQVLGGRVLRAAVDRGSLALAGTFTSVDGLARIGLAVVDARSGRPLSWAPKLPRPVPARAWGDVALAGSTLVASAEFSIYGWRNGASSPSWTAPLSFGTAPATLVMWRSAVMALTTDALRRLDARTGSSRETGMDINKVGSLQNVGGRLVGIVQGVVVAVGDKALSRRLVWCGQVSDSGASSAGVVALTGDARTLYAGDAPIDLDQGGAVPAVTACPFSGGLSGFKPPAIAYGMHGPFVKSLALIGDHVLVFSGAF
jgi:hypothetical protein